MSGEQLPLFASASAGSNGHGGNGKSAYHYDGYCEEPEALDPSHTPDDPHAPREAGAPQLSILERASATCAFSLGREAQQFTAEQQGLRPSCGYGHGYVAASKKL